MCLARRLGGLLALLIASPVVATPDSDDFLGLDLNQLVEVQVATGTLKPLAKAPAVASVITADDIAVMGAETLDEALAGVPGLHVSHSSESGAPRYLFRGMASRFNPEVLILVNGTNIASTARGDRHGRSMRIPAQAIARIEVIRGPGSAVYGADAYAGVINIILKSRTELDGTRVGLRLGSFDSQSYFLQHGGELGPLQLGFTLSDYRTDGQGETIAVDAQTGFDNLARVLGLPVPAVSLAPGAQQLMGHYTDFNAQLGYEHWKLDLGWWDRKQLGLGYGVANALDDHGRIGYEHHLVALAYRNDEFSSDWGLEGRASYYRMTQEIQRELHLFPAGAFFGAFPQGFIGNPEFEETLSRLELSGIYRGFANHRLRLGAGFYYTDLYRIAESKNFDASFAPLPGGLTDVTDTPAVFLPENDRRNTYVFVQDEWAISQDWELTAGLRYDKYSDFGSTTNPRLALVWTASDSLTAKLLYGEAFRAPTYVEKFTQNNPVSIGNPDIQPETIKTTELAFGWQPSDGFRLDLNLYRYQAEDFIRFVNDPGLPTFTAQNAASLKGHGFELEGQWRVGEAWSLRGYYSRQDTEDETTQHALGDAPEDKAYLRADWHFAKAWSLDVQVTRVGERARPAGDPREALDGYTRWDLNLRGRDLLADLDMSLGLRNVSDADIREPSQSPSAGAPFVDIPHDLPQAGRSVYLELSYSL